MTDIDRNPEILGILAGIGLGVVGLALIMAPPLAGLDMLDYGFAIQFLGFFLVIAGLVTGIIFSHRARRMNAVLAGRNLLAHWVYAPEQYQAQAQRDFQQAQQRNRILFLIVAGFMVACATLFVAVGFLQGQGDGMLLFVGIMAGVLLLVGVFALAMPHIQQRRALRNRGDVYIATDALVINGVLHTWDNPLARLAGVTLIEDRGPIRLVFRVRSLSRTNVTLYQPYTVEAPVPPGQEAVARRIEQHFRAASAGS